MWRTKIKSIYLEKAAFLNLIHYERGYWTDENDTKITESIIGKKVFFHIETKGMPDETKVEFKLCGKRRRKGMDWAKKDRKEFGAVDITQIVTFKDNHAVIALTLEKDWEKELMEDEDKLRLYWRITTILGKDLELPEKEEDYLKVDYTGQLLHIKPSLYDPDLPEIIDTDGTVMELLGEVSRVAFEKAYGEMTDYVAKEITGIALGRMEKGHMVDNKLKVHTKERTVENSLFYSQEGDIYFAKRGRNFGYRGKGTTKGIDQFEYFSTHGRKVKILGFLKRSAVAFDMYDLFSYAKEGMENDYPDLPLSSIGSAIASTSAASQAASTASMTRVTLSSEIVKKSGKKVAERRIEESISKKSMEKAISAEASAAALGIGLGIALLGVMADMKYQEGEEILETMTQEELRVAKEGGLSAIQKFVTSHRDYGLMQINNEIASRILHGEFKTIDEVEDIRNDMIKENIYLLYRQLEHSAYNESIAIIETFIIDTNI